MIASTNCGLFITAHTTSDNFNTVSPSDGDVETVWLDITVSDSDGEEDKVFVLATFSDCFIEDVVCAVINNPQFVDAIIPMVLDKVLEAMRPHVEKIRLQPYIETIEHTKTTVLAAIFVYIHIKSFVYKVQITDNKSSGNIY
jgi:hypothetical protein